MNRNSFISTTLGFPTLIFNLLMYWLSMLGFNWVTLTCGPCSYLLRKGIIFWTFSFDIKGYPFSSAFIGFYQLKLFKKFYIEVHSRSLSCHTIFHLLFKHQTLSKLVVLKLHYDRSQLFEPPFFEILTVSCLIYMFKFQFYSYTWFSEGSTRNPKVHAHFLISLY